MVWLSFTLKKKESKMLQFSIGDKIQRTCMVKGREGEGRFGLLSKVPSMSKIVSLDTDRRVTGQMEEVDTDLIYDMRFYLLSQEERGVKEEEGKLHWWGGLVEHEIRTAEDLDLEDSDEIS
jgi:hypothetical protein